MKKYFHKKLVRDRIPEIIKANSGEFELKNINDEEFEIELKKKLLEETQELVSASKENVLNELADVLEVIKSLATHYKIPFSKVERCRVDKRKKRGGFKKKLFLVWSNLPAGK
jgi:predicted house-cleaning noncanonical NTP pyrophosphatase (MazG superfamily)